MPLLFGHAFVIWLHLYILALPFMAIFLFWLCLYSMAVLLASAMPLHFGCAINN